MEKKKSKQMFWTIELNEILKDLMFQCTTSFEIAARFLLQKKELNLIIDQVVDHIRKLKSGQIKNKTHIIKEIIQNESKSTPSKEILNSNDLSSNKNGHIQNGNKWMNH